MNLRANSRPQAPRLIKEKQDSLLLMGAFTLAGLTLGLLWPKLAHLSLVTEPPMDELRPEVSEEAPASLASNAPVADLARPVSLKELISVGEMEVSSCRDKNGRSVSKCDEPEFDELLHPSLESLVSCPSAQSATGVLSLGMELDMQEGKVVRVISGRSTELNSAATKSSLLKCAETALSALRLPVMSTQQNGYTLYYKLRFRSADKVAEEAASVSPASGQASVRWRSALVREAPERRAKVLTRLVGGARVLVTGKQGDWYRVKYDAQGREAWVHGAALGLGEGEKSH